MQISAANPASSPLQPMSPPVRKVVPSSEAGQFNLLSDRSTPMREERIDAGWAISQDDAIVPQEWNRGEEAEDLDPMCLDNASVAAFNSPLKRIRELSSSPPRKRIALQDQNLEHSLLPCTFEQPPPWTHRSSSTRNASYEMISGLPPPFAEPEDISMEDIDVFSDEAIAPIAPKAGLGVEREQSVGVGSTSRKVPLSVMSSSTRKLPWHKSKDVTNLRSEDFHGWINSSNHPRRAQKLIERDLSRVPSPAELGKSEIEKEIVANESLDEYHAQPKFADGEYLDTKPEGSRILNVTSEFDGEKMNHGCFEEAKDLDHLIRKRMLAIKTEEEEADVESGLMEIDTEPLAGMQSTDSGLISDSRRDKRGAETGKHGQSYGKVWCSLSSEPFSAMTALKDFIRIRKGYIQEDEPISKKDIPAEGIENLTKEEIQSKKLTASSENEQIKQFRVSSSFQAPEYVVPDIPYPFIVGTSFFRDRKLARRVQDLYPSAEIIERDFTLHSSSKKLDMAETIADEADMIISPSTGLIWTSLQKIKQRSLPGQAARPPLHERLVRTAPRYERLVILVIEDYNSEPIEGEEDGFSLGLTKNDCEALADFLGFCSRLQENTQAFFVGGGTERRAQWIVAMMVKFGMTNPNMKLLQEETLWEIFLRRAGMNAFAAQCILAELKAPDNGHEPLPGSDNFGLAAFVNMSLEERLSRFEALFGGSKLLTRVSLVLDGRWR